VQGQKTKGRESLLVERKKKETRDIEGKKEGVFLV